MPIYAYKCESCGFAKDVLQKMSDAPLTDCPDCHAPAFKKQLTAAGFQLKGSGWYATEFKRGPSHINHRASVVPNPDFRQNGRLINFLKRLKAMMIKSLRLKLALYKSRTYEVCFEISSTYSAKP